MFGWVGAEADYGYPVEISSSLYRVLDIKPIVSNMEFSNPNELEWNMSRCIGMFQQMKPRLLCYEESVCFCNPINKINQSGNRSGINPEYLPDSLLTKMEKCGKIEYDKFRGFVSNARHQEVDINIIYKER
jgi:hypothetical protein